MKLLPYFLIFFFTSVFVFGKKTYTVEKNIAYIDPAVAGYDKESHALDVYAPVHTTNGKKNKVLVFIHGGIL